MNHRFQTHEVTLLLFYPQVSTSSGSTVRFQQQQQVGDDDDGFRKLYPLYSKLL